MDRNSRPLSEVIETGLLPTPMAADGGLSRGQMGGGGGGGFGLRDTVRELLKTPTAQLAVNGGSQHPDKRRAGGHGPTLADQVEHQLLPTPNATDSQGGPRALPEKRTSGGKDHGPRLRDVAPTLLPTPTARLGDDTSRGADPARYKGPASLNGRRSNLDDCIAAVETRAPWLGEPTSPPSADGKPSSGARHPGQLSLDEPENG